MKSIVLATAAIASGLTVPFFSPAIAQQNPNAYDTDQARNNPCRDPWVSLAVSVAKTSGTGVGRAIGSGDSDECNPALYNGGHWNSYAELLAAVRARFSQSHPTPPPSPNQQVALPYQPPAAPPSAPSRSGQLQVMQSVEDPRLCMDINESTNKVALWTCHGGPNQRFFGSYGQQRFRNNCLDIAGGQGSELIVATCDSSKPSQKWTLVNDDVSPGAYRNESGWCVDIPNSQAFQGQQLVAWVCKPGAGMARINQAWTSGYWMTTRDVVGRYGQNAGQYAAQLSSAPAGSFISHNGSSLVAAGAGNVISNAGGNLVAAGAGNLIAAGGGNLVAAGAGNFVDATSGGMLR